MKSVFKSTALILLFLLASQLYAQRYPIYDSLKPDVIPIWHRVADHASVLRAVESARLSPNGTIAVSASKFGYNLMVWRVADGTLLWEKKLNTEIECVVFSPDGTQFATGDEDYFVKIWDTKTGNELNRMEHDSSLDGIAWSHDGKLIAAGSEKGDIWFWNTANYALLGKINVGSTVNSLDFSLNDKLIVAGGNVQHVDSKSKSTRYDGFVKLVDVVNLKVIRNFVGHTGSVKSVRFSNDEKLIASGSFDNTARVFSANTGALLNTFQQALRVEAVEFSPDDHYLLVGGHERKIKFYRVWDFKLALELPSPRTEYLDFSSDGRLLLTAHEDSGLLSLYMFLSSTQHTPGLYQRIERETLNNRDIKGEN